MGVSLGGGASREKSQTQSASQGTNVSSQGSSQQSTQTTPAQLQAYFDQMNAISGGRMGSYAQSGSGRVAYDASAAAPVAYRGDVSGRVSALLGAAGPVAYQGVSADQLRAVGGLGATRTLSAQQAYGDRAAQLRSDPSMTLAQRQYAGGLNTRELAQTQDAIGREAEAAISAMAQEDALRNYTARAADRSAGMTAQTGALGAEQEQAARVYAAAAEDRKAGMEAAANRYAADVRNADLARVDAETLAKILAQFMGNNSSGSSWGASNGQQSSTSLGRSSGSSWNGRIGIGATGG